jgi:hypothetical protein
MRERRRGPRQTPEEAQEEFLEKAKSLWEDFNAWYRDHPEATYDEMEAKLGEERRGFFGGLLEQSLRQGDLGATPETPLCKECGKPMRFKGYPKKPVHGLETDARIPRAYYVCPTCKVGFFPPGPPSPVEER